MDKKIHYNVVCIGAGGTGGNFAKEFARYMAGIKDEKVTISFSLIDGDKVEKSNISRQPFSDDDMNENKAVTLVETIKDVLDLKQVYSYPDYINSPEDLNSISREHAVYDRGGYVVSYGRDILVLVGCVDNHRARQAMNDFFYSKNDIIYIDSANEFSVGEICIGVRIDGKTIAPPRSHYFPDVLKDKGLSAAEMSCGMVNISSPQHISTNLMAAHLILTVISNIISNGKIDYGIIFFDAFKYFSRFDPFDGPIPKAKLTPKGVKNRENSKR